VPNTPRPADAIDEPAARRDTIPGESLVLWVLWLTYGSFYFCRQNISTAVPGLQSELGYNKTEIGLVLGGLKVAYALGQLVNGQLSERVSARRLLAFGMLGSAALNVIFGFATGLYVLLFIWACNGYCQALGWTPCVRVAANWFPVSGRGRAIGILGTSYQAMAALTYVVAGWSAEKYGWRGALYIPASLLVLSAVHMLALLRESPADSDKPEAPARDMPVSLAGASGLSVLRLTLANPALWVLAVALFFLDACRYGFQDWGLTHLKEVQDTGVGLAALKYAVLPCGGIAGAYLTGWATDRLFGGRRIPTLCTLLILLGCLSLLYEEMARTSLPGTIALLVLIGFAIFGPQVLLVGTAPADFAQRGTAAAAAGFVNSMGYLGAFVGDQVTGYLVQNYDWRSAILFWAGCAFAAAAVAALLWRARPNSRDDVA
jgi:MFS transporter, OPA family, glycerol-3-phosphate transporter